jgi:hypothetical protein
MSTKYKYAIAMALLIIAFSVGRFSAPKSVQTKETETTHIDQNKDQDVVETSKETKLPDGTVIIEKREEKETKVQTVTNIEKQTTQTVEVRPSYRVGVSYDPPIKGFQDTLYSVTIEKRLFSEFYIGLTGNSRHELGISLSLGF